LLDIEEHGLSLEEIDQLLQKRLVPHLVHYEHPGFHGIPRAL
jgi:hypothetical protein